MLMTAVTRVSSKPFHKLVSTGCNPTPPPINHKTTGKDSAHAIGKKVLKRLERRCVKIAHDTKERLKIIASTNHSRQ